VQVRVKCVADLARWKLVMVGRNCIHRGETKKSCQYAYLYFLHVTIFLQLVVAKVVFSLASIL